MTMTPTELIAEHLPSLDVAIDRFMTQREVTIDGRDLLRFAARWVPLADLPKLGMKPNNPDNWDAELDPWNAETFLDQLAKDVAFGFEKALDQRGISANTMHSVVNNWLVVLGIRDQFTAEYAMYGLPLFREVALRFGLPNPIGDNIGNEDWYDSGE